MKLRLFTFLILVVCCSSCGRDVLSVERQEAEKTYVTLRLKVNGEVDGTKSYVDKEGASAIKNIKVIQYSGTEDDSFLEGDVSWLEGSDLTVREDGSISAKARLVSGNQPTTVFFIANSFDRGMVPPRTLGEMKNLSRIIADSNECLGYDSNNDDYYPMFTGWCTLESVQENTGVGAELSRNVAKFTLHVKNSSYGIASKLTVQRVSLHSVPSVCHYFPQNFKSTEEYPEFPVAGTFTTVDYAPVEWPADIVQGESEANADFVFYLPVNRRGSVDNDDITSKNKYAPAEASYAVIDCTCYDPDSDIQIPVSYRIFLGENMSNDFNVNYNKAYDFSINLKSKGDALHDSRITDYGPVDFSVASRSRSNCYILNPPTSDGYWRTFTIPVDRVDTFWGYGYNSATAPYEYETNYQLSPSKPWKVEVIWSDFAIDNATNFRFAGPDAAYFLGSGTTEGFRVQIPKGAKGNVIVGIRRNDSSASPYLWSWHLWITDYCPDEAAKKYVPKDDEFGYSVTGGRCYRLDFESWKQGQLYARSFMMDRNVGAYDIYYHSQKESGSLLYQYGRKDPFWEGMTMVPKFLAEITQNTVPYAVNNPNVLIMTKGQPWIRNSKYNPSPGAEKLLWNDPLATTDNHRKSIFDPCPEGWKVPEKVAFTGESAENMIWVQDAGNMGRQYKVSLMFQVTGWLNGYDTGKYSHSVNGNYWLATHLTDLHRANAFEFSEEKIEDNNRADMTAHGFAVRCVSDSQ